MAAHLGDIIMRIPSSTLHSTYDRCALQIPKVKLLPKEYGSAEGEGDGSERYPVGGALPDWAVVGFQAKGCRLSKPRPLTYPPWQVCPVCTPSNTPVCYCPQTHRFLGTPLKKEQAICCPLLPPHLVL